MSRCEARPRSQGQVEAFASAPHYFDDLRLVRVMVVLALALAQSHFVILIPDNNLT